MKRALRRYLARRMRDVLLVVAWLVVVFNCVQIARLEGETSTRIALSYGAMVAIGVAATWVWARARRRDREQAVGAAGRAAR